MFPINQPLIPPYLLPHFGVMKEVFTEEEIQRIQFFEKILDFKPGETVGQMMGEDQSEDRIARKVKKALMPIDQNTQWLWDKVAHVIGKANYDLFLYDITSLENLEYLIYTNDNDGPDFYTTHRDVLTRGHNRYDRKISGIIMLSNRDEYEGGEILIDISGNHDKTKWQKVEMNRGDVCFFDSMFLHCVEPVTEGKRQVLVFWAHGKNKL